MMLVKRLVAIVTRCNLLEKVNGGNLSSCYIPGFLSFSLENSVVINRLGD